jgi:hypothetical protein
MTAMHRTGQSTQQRCRMVALTHAATVSSCAPPRARSACRACCRSPCVDDADAQGVSDPARRGQDRRRFPEVGSLTPWLLYRDSNSRRQRPPPRTRVICRAAIRNIKSARALRRAQLLSAKSHVVRSPRTMTCKPGEETPLGLFVCLFHHSAAVWSVGSERHDAPVPV